MKHRTRLEAEAEGINYVLVAAPGVEVGRGKCGCGCGGDVMAGRQMLYRHCRRSTVKQFRIDYGLERRPREGQAPAGTGLVLTCPTKVARFLYVLPFCHGHVSQSGMVSATFASKALTGDVQTLFLRLGIQSTVSTVKMPRFHAWQVLVHARCLPRLAEQLPMWGRKRDRLSVRVAKMKLRSSSNLGAPALTPALRKELVSGCVRGIRTIRTADPAKRCPPRRMDHGGRARRHRDDDEHPGELGQRQLSPKVLGAFLTEFDLTRQHGWLLNDDLHGIRLSRSSRPVLSRPMTSRSRAPTASSQTTSSSTTAR